jgi:hypothetical protein
VVRSSAASDVYKRQLIYCQEERYLDKTIQTVQMLLLTA